MTETPSHVTGPDPVPALDYATAGTDRGSGVDGSIGVWSALQVMMGIVIAATSDGGWTGVVGSPAVGVVYAGLSVTAFLGSISPNRKPRRRLYLAYGIGFAAGLVFSEIVLGLSAGAVHGDPDLYWQWPLAASIANPALLTLLVRRAGGRGTFTVATPLAADESPKNVLGEQPSIESSIE